MTHVRSPFIVKPLLTTMSNFLYSTKYALVNSSVYDVWFQYEGYLESQVKNFSFYYLPALHVLKTLLAPQKTRRHS